MTPTVGTIVLVRSPVFIGECPGIVTAVIGELINCRVFTNEANDNYVPLICGLQAQDESSVGWGWRHALVESKPTPNTDEGTQDASGLPGVEPQ